MHSFRIWNLDEARYHLHQHLKLIQDDKHVAYAEIFSIRFLSDLRFGMEKRGIFIGWLFELDDVHYEVYVNGLIHIRQS